MKIALLGYGRMGRAVEEIAKERGHRVPVRLGRTENEGGAGITRERFEGIDIAIDFSAADQVRRNVEAASALGISLVVGTTGWESEREGVRRAVEKGEIGLVHSPNFSIGVHVFLRLVRVAGILANQVEEYDPHIVEAHHRHKRDRPSGTALCMTDILLEEVDRKTYWDEAPATPGGPDPHALQVAVSRAGENPGMHLVGLDGPDDRIEIRHEARSRMGFARGAVAAAEWLRGKQGLFTMEDWLGERLDATRGVADE